MPVATMEELAALPAGTRVRVNSRALGLQEWTIGETGLVKDGVTIDVGNFVGAVAAGSVTRADGPLIQVGDLFEHSGWTSDRYVYLVVGVDEPGEAYPRGWVRIAEFRSHEFRSISGLEPRTLGDHRRATNQSPDWLAPFRTLVTNLHTAQQEVQRLTALATPTPEVTIPEALVAELREYAGLVNDVRLDNVLNGHGIGRGHPFWVTVRMTGRSGWTPQVVQAVQAGAMTGDYTIEAVTGEPVQVAWSRVVRVQKVDPTACACNAVSREDLVSFLPPNWIDWEFTAQVCEQSS